MAERPTRQEQGSAGTSPGPDTAAETLQQEFRELKGRADRLLANWQRSEADLSNPRKRFEAEQKETQTVAVAAVVVSFLPVLDDLERALLQVAEPLKGFTWVDGLWLTYRKAPVILDALGVRQIEAEGQSFDPKRHQAVQETAGEPGKVLHLLQQGYELQSLVLRPALVVIGKASAQPPPSAQGPAQPSPSSPKGLTA
ncbi:MAG: nucleotide exchange factor GrpE [Dehalococcoidia bacterium]|nr:nucleotide exchange factor GrpE [Dehalococcoidia bacterium]